jgi:S-adenosylmethionine synthetase
MQTIETFGTAEVTERALHAFKDKLIDTSVMSIIETLDLARPIYRNTAAYGHFGRDHFPWEKVVKS